VTMLSSEGRLQAVLHIARMHFDRCASENLKLLVSINACASPVAPVVHVHRRGVLSCVLCWLVCARTKHCWQQLAASGSGIYPTFLLEIHTVSDQHLDAPLSSFKRRVTAC
jgi:hypothetical protein